MKFGFRLVLFGGLFSLLPFATACWVQSVYPFYEEPDVIVDPTLAGTWAGQDELKNCQLKITVEARTFTVELSASEERASVQCEPAIFQGRLIQIGGQRYFDLVPGQERCWAAPMDILLKIMFDKQKLAVTPLDPEWVASTLETENAQLRGRVQGSGEDERPGGSVAVTLVSPTSELREFLQQDHQAGAFSATGMMEFVRK